MTAGPRWRTPDYDRNCLTQLLPSVLGALQHREAVLPIPAADRIVVLLIDGLGHHLLDEGRAEMPFVSAMVPLVPDGIDAVFPSTTAASLTSFGTGLPPGRHGIVGAAFWLPELGNVLSPLGWRDKPSPQVVQPEPTVFEAARAVGIAATVVGPRSFNGGGLTACALRGAVYQGADSPGELILAVPAAAEAQPPALVYGYFGAVDKTAHIHGVGSPQWKLDLAWTDWAITQIARRLPRRTLLLVTADHGMVNCPDEARVDIESDGFRDGVVRISGEPRMRQIYVKPGVKPATVAQRWRELLGDRGLVLTRAEAVQAGLFGPVSHGIADRIGHVLALPTGDGALVSSRVDSIVSGLRGQHGGLTETELKVPLLAWAS